MRKDIHAVINLDKPKGMTSHDAVQLVKRAMNAKRAGHAGTLDPMATGVLLVCLGEATKISRFLMGLGKSYEAVMKFGEATDTLDADGSVVETSPVPDMTLDGVEAALEGFRGGITQVPPMYSAIKQKGRPLYELARAGVEVERNSRDVVISRLEIIKCEPPFLSFFVECSKGTYIRSLADDIGRAMGGVAHLTELRRVGIGRFKIEGSISMQELSSAGVNYKGLGIWGIDDALAHMRCVVLADRDYKVMDNGGVVATSSIYGEFPDGEYIRLKRPDGALFAVGVCQNRALKIERKLNLNGLT